MKTDKVTGLEVEEEYRGVGEIGEKNTPFKKKNERKSKQATSTSQNISKKKEKRLLQCDLFYVPEQEIDIYGSQVIAAIPL